MSMWTHVNGVIEVHTPARSSAEAMYMAQTVVEHLPRITGSERNVEYYFNLVHLPSWAKQPDEFIPYDLTNYQYFCSDPKQNRVLVTLHGDLRDRMFEQTLRETAKTLIRLSKRLWINSCLVSVNSDWGDQQYVFNNPEWLIWQDQSCVWTEGLMRSYNCGRCKEPCKCLESFEAKCQEEGVVNAWPF